MYRFSGWPAGGLGQKTCELCAAYLHVWYCEGCCRLRPRLISRKGRKGEVKAADLILESQLSVYIEELSLPERPGRERAKIRKLAVAAVEALGHKVATLDKAISTQLEIEAFYRTEDSVWYNSLLQQMSNLNLNLGDAMDERL